MKSLLSYFARGLVLALGLVPVHTALGQVLPDQSTDKSLGVVTCASALCHGSVGAWKGSAVAQNEYVIWSRLDKHARAFAVLRNDKSRSIASKLGLPQSADQSKECLGCHAHNPPPQYADARHTISDGVACEACHGPAGRWLASHTAPEARHAENLHNGLYPSEDPRARAKLCMSCHFGTTDKYVNHRTMAAGHPRLSFELATFTNLQPAHFKADSDYTRRKGADANNSAKVWAVGQAIAVGTQMAILLDEHRGRDGVFPEPTLFDCHSCHHPMADQRWQPQNAFGTSIAPGLIRLNDANALMLRLILRQLDPELFARFMQATLDLNKAIAGQGSLTVTAKAMQSLAHTAEEAIAASRFDALALRPLALMLIDDGLAGHFRDYVAAEQATMALGSLTNGLAQTGSLKSVAGVNRGLASLRALLVKDEAYKPAEFAVLLRDFRVLVAAR